MTKYRPIVIGALALLCAACTTPISASLTQDVTGATGAQTAPLVQKVTAGLQDASYNLDQAVVVGALAKTDPAPACAHAALQDLGIDPSVKPAAVAASFVPKIEPLDVFSPGSVAYIRAQQIKALQASGALAPAISDACKVMMWNFVVDAIKSEAKVGVATAAALGGGVAVSPIGPAVINGFLGQ